MNEARSVPIVLVATVSSLVAGTAAAAALSGDSAESEVFGRLPVNSILLALFLAGAFIFGPWITLRVAGYRWAGGTSALAVALWIGGTAALVRVFDPPAGPPEWAFILLTVACPPLARTIVLLVQQSPPVSATSRSVKTPIERSRNVPPSQAVAEASVAVVGGVLGAIGGGVVGFLVGMGFLLVSASGDFGAGAIVLGVAGAGALIGGLGGTARALRRSKDGQQPQPADQSDR